MSIRAGDGTQASAQTTQPKRAALLAYLATAHPRGAHERDKLLALFWPELDQARASRALSQSVHQLRAQLGEGVLVNEGRDQIRFASDAASCDVLEFEALLGRGDAESAIALYRGEFLEGFHLSDLVELERWIEDARARLRRQAADATWTLAEQRTGDAAQSVWWARRAWSLASPHDEPALRRLLAALDRAGDRAGALLEFERFAGDLARELDAAPAPETLAIVKQIRARSDAHAVPVVPPRRDAAAPIGAPVPSERSPARRASRRWASIAVAAAAVVVALGLTWSARRPAARAPASGVAVFPFTFSGAPEAAHLASGVAGLVATNLSGLESMFSVDPRAAANAAGGAALTRSEAGRIASDLGAGLFVLGTVSEVSGRLRLAATLHESGGMAELAAGTVEGDGRDLFALADELTTRLLAKRLSTLDSARVGSASLTTTSPHALQAFTAGEEAYRAGRFAAATDHFGRAVEIDSTFALAWLRLSNAAHWTGEGSVATAAAARALEHGGRLPQRMQLRVRAWDLYLRSRVEEAEPLLRAVVAEDDSDPDAWTQLGEIAFHYGASVGRPAAGSRREWERALAVAPYNMVALTHLARVAAHERRRAEFERLQQRIVALEPSGDVVTELRTLHAFAFGTRAERVAAAARVAQLPELVRSGVVAHAVYVAPDLRDAGELLLPLTYAATSFENRPAGAMAIAAATAVASGQLARAAILLDSAERIEPVRIIEYRAAVASLPYVGTPGARAAARAKIRMELRGRGSQHRFTPSWRAYADALLALRDGDTAAFSRRIVELRGLGPDTSELGAHGERLAAILEADRLLRAGRAREALERLGPATVAPDGIPGHWRHARAHERFLRGEVLATLGRTDEALQWFATFPDPNGYDLMYLLPATIRQYQIQRRLGRTGLAEAQRARIAELLRDGDPEVRRTVDSLLKS